MKTINVTSKELSSAASQQEFFENYCKERGISLDFSKSSQYNAYTVQETARAFVWFIRGLFSNVDCNPEY